VIFFGFLHRQPRLGAPFPRFPVEVCGVIQSMRLSLMKGAHADISSTAWQEIGVKPGFGLSGIPQHSTRLFLSSRPERSGEPALSEVEGDLRVPFCPSELMAPHKSHHPQLVIPERSRGICSAPRLPHKGLRSVSSPHRFVILRVCDLIDFRAKSSTFKRICHPESL
jgi:hypothetical protein